LSSIILKSFKNEANIDRSLLGNTKHLLIVNSHTQSNKIASLAWLGLWNSTKPPEPSKLNEANNKSEFYAEPLDSNDGKEMLQESAGGYLQEPKITSHDYIQDPLTILEDNVVMNALGEPTLQSLGLASVHWPTGWVQMAIEHLHIDFGLPWLQSIAVFTVLLRLSMFPITVKIQKNAAKLRKIGPTLTKLSTKMNEAKATGNHAESE